MQSCCDEVMIVLIGSRPLRAVLSFCGSFVKAQEETVMMYLKILMDESNCQFVEDAAMRAGNPKEPKMGGKKMQKEVMTASTSCRVTLHIPNGHMYGRRGPDDVRTK